MGLRPTEFWSMTFWEYTTFSNSIKEEQSRLWWHTSSLLCMQANLNRDSKKRPTPYKPQDFHPYSDGVEQQKDLRPTEANIDWLQKMGKKLSNG